MIGAFELQAAARVLVQPDGFVGLDEALSWAIGQTREEAGGGAEATAVVVADLPALNGAALEHLLTLASRHAVSMVVDRHGTGTTVLAATEPHLLVPRFGAHSATRHRRSALNPEMKVMDPDECSPAVRCDVDTLDDLAAAREIGLGRHSRLVDEQLGSPA
jgi:2-phospho-L-lactate guanylyltransferase